MISRRKIISIIEHLAIWVLTGILLVLEWPFSLLVHWTYLRVSLDSSLSYPIVLYHYTNSGVPWSCDIDTFLGHGQLGSGLYCYHNWMRRNVKSMVLTIAIPRAVWDGLRICRISKKWGISYWRTVGGYIADVLPVSERTRLIYHNWTTSWDVIDAPMLAVLPQVHQVLLRNTPAMIRVWRMAEKQWGFPTE